MKKSFYVLFLAALCSFTPFSFAQSSTNQIYYGNGACSGGCTDVIDQFLANNPNNPSVEDAKNACLQQACTAKNGNRDNYACEWHNKYTTCVNALVKTNMKESAAEKTCGQQYSNTTDYGECNPSNKKVTITAS